MSQMNSARKVSRDYVYMEIKEKIISGAMEPDQPVIEEELAKELEISRTPLREALTRLEMEELVIRQRNGRLKVAPISIQEVQEIFEVRSMLEGIVIRTAVMNATEQDIVELKQIIDLSSQSHKEGRAKDVILHGGQFHAKLYQMSQNHTAVKILNQLNAHISRYRSLGPYRYGEQSIKTIDDHEIILNYMMSRDKDGAEMIMRAHIKKSLSTVIEAIQKYNKEKEGTQ